MTSTEPNRPEAKTLRVSVDTHARLMQYMRTMRLRSVDEAISMFLDDKVLRIPLPDVVHERWADAADKLGYPMDKWVAQIVEAHLSYGSSPARIQLLMTSLVQSLQHLNPDDEEDQK
jgi:hypothetical protein